MSSMRSTTWFVGNANNDMWHMLSGTCSETNVNSIPEALSSYETTQCEYSIASFIGTYQHTLPQLVMIKKGSLGYVDYNSLDTGQVLRIHGVHSERRVLAKVTKDSRNCFGYGDVVLSIPITFPVPMCRVTKSGSSKTAKLLKTIIKRHTLPMTVQLMATTRHDIQLTGNVVLLTGDVRLRLLKEYEGKYIYGNPVKIGEVYRNIISVPSCETNVRLTVITGLASHNNEHWQSILEQMNHTVNKYINFDDKLCNTDIFDCSSSDLKIEQLVDEPFTEPGNNHSSGPKVKVLVETFTELGNKHSAVPTETVVDEIFTEPDKKHSSGPKVKVLVETFTEPDNKHSSGSKENNKSTEPENKHSSGPNENVLEESFTEPDNKHSSGQKENIGTKNKMFVSQETTTESMLI